MDRNMVEALGTWFAGVATAGSLWLGFTILRSDRKKEERSQASRFLIWSDGIELADGSADGSTDGSHLDYILRVWNTSDMAIFFMRIRGLGNTIHCDTLVDPSSSMLALHPGEQRQYRAPWNPSLGLEGVSVFFRDAAGSRWKYEVYNKTKSS